ncbi:MAG: hypothetical protein DSZ03_00365 [Sulfurimonas sp.]|nr:MAG: hypothetical protein DSZ03_00365 [Sulfurimonas sp.]
MKHHLLRLMALLLLAVPVLQAQMQEKKIIVSSLETPEKAERALEQLQKYLDNYPEIASLLDDNGIALHSRPSGKYFIVVIEPFSSKENLSKVKKTIQNRYPGLFVNNYTPETDVIVSESTTSPKVTIQEEVTLDMVTEEVPESLVIIKDSEDATPRVVAADKVEVPKVIAIEKETLEAKPVEAAKVVEAPKVVEAVKENADKISETAAVIKDTLDNNVAAAKETIETQVEEAPKVVAAVKQKVEEAVQKAVPEAKAPTDHIAEAPISKEQFINHHPDNNAQAHDSIFPPWWVLLSVLALILSPIGSYLENRNNTRHR